jgi:type I restriction enzyme S subunit
MRSEWKYEKLGDLASINKESYSKKEDWKYVNYLDTGNVTKGIIDEIVYIDLEKERLPSRARRKVSRNDIVYSTVRPNHEHYGIIKHPVSNMLVSTGFVTLSARDELDPFYLYYFLSQPNITDYLQAIAEQRVSTYPALHVSDVSNLSVSVPPLIAQRAIAATLSCLDTKIELNNKINENLEAQAQAIFKSWFVDFEPFQDGKFIESELGLIPEGWHVKPLSVIVASTIAGDWGKAEPEGNHTAKVYCIRGADIPDVQWGNKGKMPTRYTLPKNIESKRLQSGNLVVEISGGSPTQSTGRVVKISDYLLGRYDADMICTNFCRALSVEPPYSTFLYRYWLHMYDLGIMFGYENGTTGIKNFDLPSFLMNTLIALPPNEVLEEYNGAMDVFEARVYGNGLESEVLSTLRDTLLPKLMSGEIEVPVD